MQDRLIRVDALLSTSPPHPGTSNDRRVNSVSAVPGDGYGLFQSFTLRMEKIEDHPVLEHLSTEIRPAETLAISPQSKEPRPGEHCSTKDNSSEDAVINQQFIVTLPEVPTAYPARDTSIHSPSSYALTIENLGAVDINLPTLPPTPSSHHEEAAAKIASIPLSTPASKNLTSLSPAEDDGTSAAPPEQEVGEVCFDSSCTNFTCFLANVRISWYVRVQSLDRRSLTIFRPWVIPFHLLQVRHRMGQREDWGW